MYIYLLMNQFNEHYVILLCNYSNNLMIFRYDKWDEYHKEIEEMNVNVENFTVSLLKYYSFILNKCFIPNF